MVVTSVSQQVPFRGSRSLYINTTGLATEYHMDFKDEDLEGLVSVVGKISSTVDVEVLASKLLNHVQGH